MAEMIRKINKDQLKRLLEQDELDLELEEDVDLQNIKKQLENALNIKFKISDGYYIAPIQLKNLNKITKIVGTELKYHTQKGWYNKIEKQPYWQIGEIKIIYTPGYLTVG